MLLVFVGLSDNKLITKKKVLDFLFSLCQNHFVRNAQVGPEGVGAPTDPNHKRN